jgi:N-glycosylase/DNA lyase
LTKDTISLADLRFDPRDTFDSGQVFRWRPSGENRAEWFGVIDGAYVKVNSQSANLIARSPNSKDFDSLVSNYFSFEDNLSSILTALRRREDSYFRECSDSFKGLRLLRQDPWECLVSFVCSINSNIPSIKYKIENLCKRFGERIEVGVNDNIYSFPTPNQLSRAEKVDLLGCKVGFRWRYIKFIAERVACGDLSLETLSDLPYEKARDELISRVSGKTLGVGPKVADCVLLYGLHKTQAFPIDVWILNCLRRNYKEVTHLVSNRTLSAKNYFQISDLMRSKFGKYAGYAQLYLYEKFRRESRITQNRAPA